MNATVGTKSIRITERTLWENALLCEKVLKFCTQIFRTLLIPYSFKLQFLYFKLNLRGNY